MAQICAGRCLISYIKSEPEEVFTFGSPRIGNREYVEYPRLKHYRWVNNNDIVPRVPPMLLGYTHSGIELYLNHLGKIRQITGWRRVVDRARGFLDNLVKFRIDHLSDHSVLSYIDCIFEACLIEEMAHKRHSPLKDTKQPMKVAGD
jgi:triacylglycerol lipase